MLSESQQIAFCEYSVLNKNQVSGVEIKKFLFEYSSTICGWVPDRKTLRLIASEKSESLDNVILRTWVENSINAYIIFFHSIPIGFATIGKNEWNFPKGICEIGHLIINPESRLKGFGTIMLLLLLEEIRCRGFEAAAARSVLDNTPAIKMLLRAGWVFTHEPWCGGSFHWFLRRC